MLLAKGDRVGVMAPGFAVRPKALSAGVRHLERLGFEVVLGEHVHARHGYFAGTDAQRVSDLNRFFRDRALRAVWFARGGYGTARLLDALDWKALARGPRVLIGYSDLTALFAAAQRRTRRPPACLYGPVVAEMGDPSAYHAPSLRELLRGRSVRLSLRPRQVIVPGRARGIFAGGNLTVLVHLLGTPHAPDLDGRVLFLEDVGEEAYRIDRLLWHLRSSGALEGVAGVVLGHFSRVPTRRTFPPDRALGELFRETFGSLRVPVVSGVPAGHLPRKRTLPLGGEARLDTRAGRLEIAPMPSI